MDSPSQRTVYLKSASYQLPNGFILPEGKLTPNALFVGGIDMKDEDEIWELFGRFGNIKEVKVITYSGGISKGYGFVYFMEDVDIKTIVEQQIIFKGKKLKLGPAILKDRTTARPGSTLSHLFGPAPWIGPTQYYCCSCCPPVGRCMAPPPPDVDVGRAYVQPYTYSSVPGYILPQMPVNYVPASYLYPYSPPHWTGEQQRTRLVNQVGSW